MAIVFENCCPKHPTEAYVASNLRTVIIVRNFAIRHIRDCQIYAFSFFHKILKLNKFEGTYLKHIKVSSDLSPKIPKVMYFLSQI